MFELEAFRPTSWRRRVLIALLTLATVVFVTWAMTRRWGLVRAVQAHASDEPVCTKGQTQDCVGSMSSVIVAPAAPASR